MSDPSPESRPAEHPLADGPTPASTGEAPTAATNGAAPERSRTGIPAASRIDTSREEASRDGATPGESALPAAATAPPAPPAPGAETPAASAAESPATSGGEAPTASAEPPAAPGGETPLASAGTPAASGGRTRAASAAELPAGSPPASGAEAPAASGAATSAPATSGAGTPAAPAASGAEAPATPTATPSLLRQALNIPNLLSLLRLAGVPVFLWLLLGPREDGWALALLVFSALTDWLDGKLARWLNQMSRLGQLLDPAADRLYIAATLVAFLVRGIVPWWVVAPLVLRELVVGVCLVVLRRHGFLPPDVTYAGKAATFVLMYAFPLLLLTQGGSAVAAVARPFAYAFTAWGCVLYLWSGALYVIQTISAVRGAARTPVM